MEGRQEERRMSQEERQRTRLSSVNGCREGRVQVQYVKEKKRFQMAKAIIEGEKKSPIPWSEARDACAGCWAE